MQNYKLEREVKKRPELGKSIKEWKARIGLEYHLITTTTTIIIIIIIILLKSKK